MNSIDELFRNEILEDLEEDTIFDDDNSLIEATMSDKELSLLDEVEESINEDTDIEDILSLDDNDEIDDLMDLEDAYYE